MIIPNTNNEVFISQSIVADLTWWCLIIATNSTKVNESSEIIIMWQFRNMTYILYCHLDGYFSVTYYEGFSDS